MKSYIPTIDISSLLDGKFVSKEAKRTIQSIKKACVEVGFFQVIGHGLKNEEIKNICAVGNKFFNMKDKYKRKLSPKKWNKQNKNIYRGYFPNDVNGKEGLDLGDLKVSSKYSNNIKNQYIENLNLQKCFNSKAVKKLNNYFDNIFCLSEILFKSIIVYYKKDPKISNQAFSNIFKQKITRLGEPHMCILFLVLSCVRLCEWECERGCECECVCGSVRVRAGARV